MQETKKHKIIQKNPVKNNGIFTFFYYSLLLLLFLFLSPLIFLLSFRAKYRNSIYKRFFPIFNKPFNKNAIWFHTCSFGEVKAIKPILDSFDKNEEINISVITNTGFNEGSKYTSNIRFLPFEIFLPFWQTQQKVLVVLEAELWYMLFLLAKTKNTPTILLNARISDRSYKGYKRFSFFYKKLFKNIDYVFAQSQIDKERLEELGARNIEVLGNIKLFSNIKIENRYTKPDCLVVTGGSTHEKEEELILSSWNKKGKLIIVPRHPERFLEVRKLMNNFAQKNNLTFSSFSKSKTLDSDLILVDLMGELNEIYAISDVVILGGAFAKIGGHNAVEPASFGCKIISGKHYFNQKALFPFIENIIICEDYELKDYMNNLEKIKPTKILNTPDIKIIKEKILKPIWEG